MYTLTLTSGERQAFDWVGGRYDSSGNAMSTLIMEGIPDDAEWDSDADITFDIPEYIAWQMRELAEGDGFGFPCFGGNLPYKLNNFMERIV